MNSFVLGFTVWTLLFVYAESEAGFGPTPGEKDVCKTKANGRKLTEVTKSKRYSCDVICCYEGDVVVKETYNSPTGTLCCMIGGAPTGKCTEDGKCPPGSIIK